MTRRVLLLRVLLRLALPLLIQAIDRPRPEGRIAIAETLGKIGGNSRQAKAALEGLLQDDDASVREAAGKALQNLEP